MSNTLPIQLMDTAFALVKNRSWAVNGHYNSKQKLLLDFPQHSQDEIDMAYTAAQEILEACNSIGDQCRTEALTYEEAEAFLSEQFPGFSRDVYIQAIAHGLFISR